MPASSPSGLRASIAIAQSSASDLARVANRNAARLLLALERLGHRADQLRLDLAVAAAQVLGHPREGAAEVGDLVLTFGARADLEIAPRHPPRGEGQERGTHA